jgi:membrane-bound metal-dependent hydrolase YbcI (DUF457 family)
MEWPTHQLIGLTCALPVAEYTCANPTSAALLVGGSALGSLLPDVDHVNAKIHQPTDIERDNPLFGMLGWIMRIPLRLASHLPHRGPMTHGFPALVIVLDGVAYTNAVASPAVLLAVLGITVGYLAHLLADGVTVMGLPGYPFCRHVYTVPSRLRIRTGSRGEARYALGTAVVFLALCVHTALAFR